MRIAVSSGEPAGIGPELCLQLAQWQATRPELPALVVLADKTLLAERARALDMRLELVDYQPRQQTSPGQLAVLHLPLRQACVAGELNAANAPYVLNLLDRALAGCQSGEFAAMVTAPVHKGIINEAGTAFSGHTEYLAEKTRTPQVVMLLAGQIIGQSPPTPLRVALVTTHLPLKDVAAAITPELLRSVLHILVAEMRRKYGIAQPRVLVSGLNPHAGEGGHLGREEIEIIIPVLDELRQSGLQLIGPLPADTLFTPPILAQGDVVLAMYHDQGLSVLKYATFGQGINVTLGLPIIRTSVDHGTALELSATGKASPASLFAAIEQAAWMVARSERPGIPA